MPWFQIGPSLINHICCHTGLVHYGFNWRLCLSKTQHISLCLIHTLWWALNAYASDKWVSIMRSHDKNTSWIWFHVSTSKITCSFPFLAWIWVQSVYLCVCQVLPVAAEVVERWRRITGRVGVLDRHWQRRSGEQLLILGHTATERLTGGDGLERDWEKDKYYWIFIMQNF